MQNHQEATSRTQAIIYVGTSQSLTIRSIQYDCAFNFAFTTRDRSNPPGGHKLNRALSSFLANAPKDYDNLATAYRLFELPAGIQRKSPELRFKARRLINIAEFVMTEALNSFSSPSLSAPTPPNYSGGNLSYSIGDWVRDISSTRSEFHVFHCNHYC